MKIFKKFEFWLGLILLILVIVIIILEIYTSSIRELSQLELALFIIMQFIFSISFAYLLSRTASKQEFFESQKKFAMAAYRRIYEIDKAIERLLSRISHQMHFVSNQTGQELELISEIGKGIRETIKSSIADWMDIIGEEIETIEKIQTIKEDLNKKFEQRLDKISKFTYKKNYDEKVNQEIDKLISSLPKEMKSLAKEIEAYYQKSFDMLDEELKKWNSIELECLWEPPMEKGIYNYKEGDVLHVRLGDVGEKIGVLIVYDSEGHALGVAINMLPFTTRSYHDFVSQFISYLGTSEFDVKVAFIPTVNNETKMHAFRVHVIFNEKIKLYKDRMKKLRNSQENDIIEK